MLATQTQRYRYYRTNIDYEFYLDVNEHHGYLEHQRLLHELVLDEESVAVGDAEEDEEAPHSGEEAGDEDDGQPEVGARGVQVAGVQVAG